MTEYGNSADMDGIWGIWDLPFLQFFAGRLSEMPEPFCAAVFTVSSHHPFEVPEEYEGEFRPGETKMHEAVQYTDLALRRFFERVSREPWFDRTLFVLTADHVSSEVTLPEYKTSWGKYAVPILFYSKNMLPLFDTHRTAQQTDILPSVLSRLNYDKPFVAFGKDLFSAGDSTAFNYAAPAYQLMTSDGMLQHDGKEALGFYDYRVDRRMQRNILEGQPKEIRTVLEGQLKARIQQYNNRMVEDRLVIR
jgi:phosphoglycerol transferase MdoB-like AlkP superfamily enzyme